MMPSPSQLTTRQKVMIASIAFAVVVITAFVLWFLITHPIFTASLRNISIILLAITMIVMDVIIVVLIWQLIRLIEFLLIELKPILESLQETSSTVRGTANFMSDGVVSPGIEVAAKYAGLRQSLSTLARGPIGWSRAKTGQAAEPLTQEKSNNGQE